MGVGEKEYLDKKANEIKKLGDKNVIAIGRILIEVKSKLANHGDGVYCEWLIKTVKISRETARIYENRARIYLETECKAVKEVSNETIRYLVRNEKKLTKDRTVEILENKGLANELIENEKIDEFGKVYQKFKVESEKFLTLKSKKKREESVKEKIKALTKLESSLKKLVKEVAEMKKKAEKQRDNEMNTKIFN